MTLSRVALAGLFSGVVGLSGCTSVRRIEVAQYLEYNAPEVVWVTRTNNTVLPVAEAVVSRDTLRGVGLLPGDKDQKVKIPLSEIQSVEARVRDGTKTALLLAGLGVVAVSSLYIAFISEAGPGGNDDTCGVDHNGDPIQDC